MLEALTPWMTPAIVVAVLIYMHRTQRRAAEHMEARLRQDVSQLGTRLREDMKQLESRLESRMDRMESRLREDMKRLDGRVSRLEHGQAKLEGLLEGLREAITRQPAA